MNCSIIIRSYNEEQHIGRLLAGIESQVVPKGIQIEVILVDSGSTDSTTTIASHMGAKVIAIQKKEFSFGRALNLGCAESQGDILLFASAHVYPIFTDWIEKMISPFENDRVALVYGRQVGNERTRFSEHQIFSRWFPSQSDYNQLTPFCNNANCAIRKSLWMEQQYEEHLTGLEDIAWAKKILEKGFHIVYEAEAPIVHIHEETAGKIKNRYQREAIALSKLIPGIKFVFTDFCFLLFTNITSDLIQAINKKVLIREWRWIFVFRFMQFYGTYLGHRQKGLVSKELKDRFYFPNGIEVKHIDLCDDFDENRRIQYL